VREHRTYYLGYKIRHHPLLDFDSAPDLKLSTVSKSFKHPVVSASLGFHILGYAMPECDTKDVLNSLASIGRRVGMDTAPIIMSIRKFKHFVWAKLRREFDPLPLGTDTSFEVWLAKTSYPEWKKNQLRETWKNMNGIPLKRHKKVRNHIKKEAYDIYKAPRAIMSRRDGFKCYAGPICKCVEEEVFKHPTFIKHIPITDRPVYIHERLGPGPYNETDFTCYEGSFKQEIQQACEVILFKYMTKNIEPRKVNTINKVITGVNKMNFRNGVRASIIGRRMSGEMTTSLSNGFTNWMLVSYLAFLKNPDSVVNGVFEGDDGLFTTTGCKLVSSDFDVTGFRVKLKSYAEIGDASFCGLSFAPEDMANVRDPIKTILKLATTRSQRLHSTKTKFNGLKRAKAYSLLYELPRCPVVSALGMNLLERTEGIQPVYEWNYWQNIIRTRDKIDLNVHVKPPGLASRRLVSKRYGISIKQQLTLESYLRRCDVDTPLDHPLLLKLCSQRSNAKELGDYYHRYSVRLIRGTQQV
jgi:hypothetical protein